MRIMIADDSPMIHRLLKKFVEESGHEVCFQAENGQEVLDNIEETKPDLIFMDITMPVMEGLEAFKRLRESNVDIPVIFLSAMGDEEIVNEAKKNGAANFLTKPFKKQDILEALKFLEV
ncbi:MAG: response regulator [Tepidanaerobacteraceae bacterium]|jgi:two-component system chemotaxis response regulator CheY|nr:response regulator [Tepidanaerobacteraceae bacterium]